MCLHFLLPRTHMGPWAAQSHVGCPPRECGYSQLLAIIRRTQISPQQQVSKQKIKSNNKLARNICEYQLGFPYLPRSRPWQCAAQHAGEPFCKQTWKYLYHLKMPLHVLMDPNTELHTLWSKPHWCLLHAWVLAQSVMNKAKLIFLPLTEVPTHAEHHPQDPQWTRGLLCTTPKSKPISALESF